ncbi:MAG: hypothetical protein UW68_C0022G0011 [Candidatus Collierbacteria bacterium GW2011_GWB1_44_6]|uniref:Uncharacterized protein n=2 Tax=Candidatus Collieribacteriota TaxID=1752725 RepID=A0A0G1JNC8_9BACT|nr:MAG: hypothetical protein UV68_C0011G0009 [Candidatus Collierbacteria bacterium GW2011_GWC2_43_12]KKT72873.1 MAG: hypothetical protein UW68_C0022G0011 [Candidatus Collierbacteria bacterium GW2011_GWB1_44_6]KKT82328.1 MAG: hypothetical protein UW80_C0039G0006 [Microgenomates group bacterium GW2011_GWC1_44_9]
MLANLVHSPYDKDIKRAHRQLNYVNWASIILYSITFILLFFSGLYYLATLIPALISSIISIRLNLKISDLNDKSIVWGIEQIKTKYIQMASETSEDATSEE